MDERKDEIVALKDRTAHILQDRAKMMNSGKVYEEVSKRQQRRKLSHIHNTAKAALWFAETLELIPDQPTTHTAHSGEQVVVEFATNHSPSSPDTASTAVTARHPDEFCAMQTLYLLDRFGVSDEFYHELTQVRKYSYLRSLFPDLPQHGTRTHAVKAIRKQLNDQMEVIPIKDGAYRPLKPTLTTVIEHEVPCSYSVTT